MKKKTYYFVKHDSYGQHGTLIEPVELTEQEYVDNKNSKSGMWFEKYGAALYYVQD